MSTPAIRPPLTPGLPLIGNAIDIAQAPVHYFVDAYRELGPVYRVRIPTAPDGELTVIAGTDANLLAQRKGNELFTTRQYYHHLTRETGTDNYLCALDGEPHSEMRRTLKPGFSREAMAPFLHDMIDVVREAAQGWEVESVVKVTETLNRLTIDQLSLVATNRVIDADTYAALESYAKTFVGAGVALRPPIMFHFPGYKKSKHHFEQFLIDSIDQHRQNPPDVDERTPDLIDMLLGAEYDGEPLRNADLVASAHLPYVNGLIYAGRVCAYLLYALLQDRDLFQQVYAEVDTAFADGYPTINTLRRMRLLRNAIMETYRLYPIAPSVPRYAGHSFDFAGHHIEAGTTVFVAMIVPHFDPNIYPEPFRFDPYRFSQPRNEHRVPGAFAPYGLGSHVCLSAGMVETVVMTTMCGLLRTIEMELAPPDYEIRTTVKPVPGPEEAFSFQVTAHRPEEVTSPIPDSLGIQLSETLPMLDDQQIIDALESVEIKTYPQGTTVIEQGDAADAFYIIMEGEVEILKARKDGATQVVDRLKKSQYFGEIGLLHGVPRTATVRTMSPLEVIVMDRDDFMDIVYDADLTSGEIAEVMQRRLIKSTLAVSLPKLHKSTLTGLVPQFELAMFDSGETIIEQGSPADNFYIIVKGQVAVVNHHPTAGDIHLGTLGEGEYFGEIGLLQDRPRTATVRAAQDGPVEVLALPREAFEKMLASPDQVGEELAMMMVERLIHLIEVDEQQG